LDTPRASRMRLYTWPWGKAARGHAWSLQSRMEALGDAATGAFSSRDLTTVRRPLRRSIIAESPCRLEVFPEIRHQSFMCWEHATAHENASTSSSDGSGIFRVVSMLTLMANCLPLFGTHNFMRLTSVEEWRFCDFATSVNVDTDLKIA
jgi:hypothetical protein